MAVELGSDGPLMIEDGHDPLIYVRAEAVIAKIVASLARRDPVEPRSLWVEACDELGEDLDLRVAVVTLGLPASVLGELAQAMGLKKAVLIRELDVSPRMVSSREREDRRLPKNETIAVLSLYRWVGEVERWCCRGVLKGHVDSAEWLGRWLNSPQASLKGNAPKAYLDTSEGMSAVGHLLAKSIDSKHE